RGAASHAPGAGRGPAGRPAPPGPLPVKRTFGGTSPVPPELRGGRARGPLGDQAGGEQLGGAREGAGGFLRRAGREERARPLEQRAALGGARGGRREIGGDRGAGALRPPAPLLDEAPPRKPRPPGQPAALASA